MNPLTLSSPSFDFSALDRANLAPGTLRHYKAEITRLQETGISPFDYTALVEHANALPSSARSNLKAALNIVTKDYVNKAKASNAPVESIQRFLWLVDAMNEAVTITQPATQRQPHWLSQEQVNQLTALALSRSMRDYIVLGVLLGAGLRREELENLTFDSVHQMPHKGRMRDCITIIGKGGKKRTIPISTLLAKHLGEWKETVGGATQGRVARSQGKAGRIGDSLSAYGIFTIVRKYGALLGIPDLDPHDLRRSYGRLFYEATHGDIMLVKNLLGHESVRTTQEYIGLNIDLDIDESAFPVGQSNYVMQVAGD